MDVSIVADDVAKCDLDAMEEKAIAKHNTLRPHGYNIMPSATARPWDVPELAGRMRAERKTEEYGAMLKSGHTEERKERTKKGFARWLDNGGLEVIQKNAEKARQSCKTPEAIAKMRATYAAKREARLATLPPKEAERAKRKAFKDSVRWGKYMEAKVTDYGEGFSRGGVCVVVDPEDLGADRHREAVLCVRDLERVQHDAGQVALRLRRAICDAEDKSETTYDRYRAWLRCEWA